MSGVTEPVGEGLGVTDGVGLGVTGVLVGTGSGVSVAWRVATAVAGVAVGGSSVDTGVQVGGTAEPESSIKIAAGARVGSSAANNWQPLKNIVMKVNVTKCQGQIPAARNPLRFRNLFLMRLFCPGIM